MAYRESDRFMICKCSVDNAAGGDLIIARRVDQERLCPAVFLADQQAALEFQIYRLFIIFL